VAKHAMKIGKLTKGAYGNIVNSTMKEFKGVAELSEGEMSDLKDELMAGWDDVQSMLTKTAVKHVAKRLTKGKPKKRSSKK
jgi:hypothetical protein